MADIKKRQDKYIQELTNASKALKDFYENHYTEVWFADHFPQIDNPETRKRRQEEEQVIKEEFLIFEKKIIEGFNRFIQSLKEREALDEALELKIEKEKAWLESASQHLLAETTRSLERRKKLEKEIEIFLKNKIEELQTKIATLDSTIHRLENLKAGYENKINTLAELIFNQAESKFNQGSPTRKLAYSIYDQAEDKLVFYDLDINLREVANELNTKAKEYFKGGIMDKNELKEKLAEPLTEIAERHIREAVQHKYPNMSAIETDRHVSAGVTVFAASDDYNAVLADIDNKYSAKNALKIAEAKACQLNRDSIANTIEHAKEVKHQYEQKRDFLLDQLALIESDPEKKQIEKLIDPISPDNLLSLLEGTVDLDQEFQFMSALTTSYEEAAKLDQQVFNSITSTTKPQVSSTKTIAETLGMKPEVGADLNLQESKENKATEERPSEETPKEENQHKPRFR